MAKKLHKFHQIIVHPNRWLVWAIVYGIFVTIALVGYIQVTEVNFESQIAENTFQPWHTFQDIRLGFRVHFPADWSIEAVNSSMINIFPSTISDEGVSVLVVPPASENAIRKTLKIVQENTIRVDGSPAQKIINDLGGGHSETVVLAQHNNKLYELRGTDNLVMKLVLTFQFR
ncbi:MAG: hypothetical protein ABI643_00605 [Candidatus Doudnabacteria bacterium]